jgi:phage gpG-like protein
MISIDCDMSGLEYQLRGMETALGNLRPVWAQVRDVLVDFIKQHFDTEGAYGGQRWMPLSPSYAAYKARHAPGKSILRFKDRLYGSLTRKNHAEQVFRMGENWMEWGTKVPYARIHQTGSLKVQNRPPRRVVLPPLTKNEGERIVDIFLAYMLKRTRLTR